VIPSGAKKLPRFETLRLSAHDGHAIRTLAVALLVVLPAACSRHSLAPEPPQPTEITNVDEAGLARLREQYRGRVLLINFWATWCEPCRDEFPGLVRLDRAYHSRGLSVVEISMDEPQSVPAIKNFLHSNGARFGSYRGNFHDFVKAIDSIQPAWQGGIPASFLYDRDGKLVAWWEGEVKFEEFDQVVTPLLD